MVADAMGLDGGAEEFGAKMLWLVDQKLLPQRS
eukprot:CAMPEP_0183752000 /NCGR_PEP_ID=MMETSP0739-20130205/2093_1 /TAXON_ID=385413 /ORGANISM="Thalassiosira miniscula, Strain CCMP1093" /LENGTH=32 /DNA_ID= /DNA_START= /DNA_END= /DNA_ORIENTATION=